MEAMKILVTGGAGFIGSHVVDAYIADGHTVVVFDDLSSGKQSQINSQAVFVEGTVIDEKALNVLFTTEGPFDIVCHLAAQKSVTKSVSDPILDAQINILGSLNLFETAHRFGTKRLIFASTGGAIYGEAAPVPSPEDAEAQPISPYGIAKYAVENYLRHYRLQGMTTQTLRFANVYGPRQDPYGEAGVVAIFCQKVIGGEPLTIYGDGEQVRDFVYVGDVVSAVRTVTAMTRSGLWNIGTGNEVSVNTIAHEINKIADQYGYKEGAVHHAEPRSGEMRRSALDITRASQELGWRATTTLNNGLTETFRSFVQ